jgi:signal recognition particle receptor subunit beta
MMVLDSNDRDRFDEFKREIFNLIYYNNEVIEHSILLIVANKQDLENAMKVEEIKEKLELDKLRGVKYVNVIGTCAIKGEGLYECLDWISSTLSIKELNEPLVDTYNDAKGLTRFINSSMISSFFSSTKKQIQHNPSEQTV